MPITEGKPDIKRETARVFFAIWPDSIAQKQLVALAEQLQAGRLCIGRKTEPENIHLTLVFVGEVDTSELDALCLAADEVRGRNPRAFDVVIEGIRYWKHKGIVYAAPGKVPRELGDLVNALQDALFAAGFSTERRTYKPHITLMRKASCQGMPHLAEPILWKAREWTLVKSTQTGNEAIYSQIGRWSLS